MPLNPETVKLIQAQGKLFESSPEPVNPNDFKQKQNIVSQMVGQYESVPTQDTREEFESYIPGKIDPIYGDIDERRARAQSTLGLIGKGIGQFASESILGMPEAIGYGMDFEEVYNADKQSREGFNNWFSEGFSKAKEYVQDELFPIYQTREAQDGDFFDRITDASWLASQGKTFGTTVALMAPSFAIGALGSAVAGPLGGAVAASMFSRKAESAMEANGVFQQEYARYLNEGKSDNEAKMLAGKIASTTFKGNAALLPLDFIQYATLFKPLAGFAKTLSAAKATKIGTAAGVAINMASEGAEEGYQNIIQNEAIKSVREGVDPFGQGFGDRLDKYMEDPEFQTSVFMGAATGGLFDAAGHVFNKIKDRIEVNSVAKSIAANLNDKDSFDKIDNRIQAELIAKSLHTNQLDNLRSSISAFADDANSKEDLDKDLKADINKKASKFLENIDYIKNADEELRAAKPEYVENPNVRRHYVMTKYEDKVLTESINDLTNQYNNELQSLSDPKDRAVVASVKLTTAKNALDKLNNTANLDPKIKSDRAKEIESDIDKHSAELEVLLTDIKTDNPSFKLSEYSLPNIDKIKKINQQLTLAKIQRDIKRNTLAKFENKTPEEIAKEEASIKKTTLENSLNVQRKAFADEVSTIDTQDAVTDFTLRVDQSALPVIEKEAIKKQALAKYNEIVKRQSQHNQNTANTNINDEIAESVPEFTIPESGAVIPATPQNQGVPVIAPVQTSDESGYDQGAPNQRDTDFINSQLGKPTEKQADTTDVLNDLDKTDEVKPLDESKLEDTFKKEEKGLVDKEKSRTATGVTIAHVDKNGVSGSDVYFEGKAVLSDSVNQNLFDPSFANKGTKILLQVDTQYQNPTDKTDNYSKHKGNPKEAPIKITTESGEVLGYVHTISWITNQSALTEEVKKSMIDQTRLIREFFFENGTINPSKVGQSVIEEKTPGWLNLNESEEKEINGKKKSVRKSNPIDKSFKQNGKWDERVRFTVATGEKASDDVVNPDLYMTLSGCPLVEIPGCNGEYISKFLKQSKLKNAPKDVQSEYAHNILGIIVNAIGNKGIVKNELIAEISKYLHATDKTAKKLAQELSNKRLDLLFNVDLFEGTATEQRNVIVSVHRPGTENYDIFKITLTESGPIISKRTNVKENTFSKVGLSEFKNILVERLGEKYLNVTREGLEKPSEFKRLEADDKYNVKEVSEDYRDFSSRTGALSTHVHGITLSDGSVTYATQPNLIYSPILSGETKATIATNESELTEKESESVYNEDDAFFSDGELPDMVDFEMLEAEALGFKSELDFGRTSVSSFSLIPNVNQENDLVSSITNSYLDIFQSIKLNEEDSKNKAEIVLNKVIEKFEEHYKNAIDGKLYKSNARANEQVARFTKLILDNFNASYNSDGSVKFVGYKTKLRLELDRLKFNPLEAAEEVASNEEVADAQYIDNKNFMEDPEKSASSRIKRGLTSLPKYEGGKLKTNIIGTKVFRDYYEVFNTIMEATADLSIMDIRPELEDLAKSFETRDGNKQNVYSQVVDLLNKAEENKAEDNSFYNEFMSVFKKQRTRFIKPVIYTKTDGLPHISLYNSNKSGAAGVLFSKWAEGVKNSKIVAKINEELRNGKSKEYNDLIARFNNADQFPITTGEYYKEMSEILTSVGLEISPEAIEKMSLTFSKNPKRLSSLKLANSSGRKYTNFKTLMHDNYIHLMNEFVIGDTTPSDEEDDGISNDMFKKQSALISTLARYETVVNPNVLSNSFRNGNGDVVYGFVNPHHLSNTIENIKSSQSKLQELIEDKFSSHSTWLDEDSLKEVELFYLDSATNGNSKKSAVSFEDMSELEKEQTKAALVLNKGAKKGYFLMPTPSDKTTFAILSGLKMDVAKSDLEIGSDGVKLKSTGVLIDKLYKLLVESEIHRIHYTAQLVKDAVENKTLDKLIKGEHYNIIDGKVVLGSRGYFFLMPQMNEFFKERLNNALDPNTTFVIGSEELMPGTTQTIESAAKAELANQINRLHEIKSNSWNKLGMGSRLDSNYSQKISGSKIPAANFNSYAAMDYVVNSMVGYANQFMMITGDPASFVKADKSWDGTHNTWRSMIDGTVTNMFKRTAKDIAPGYEGMFDKDEQSYNSVFIDEPKKNSRMVSEYEGKLKNVITSTFTDLEYADAQEWTTLPEHVKVLAAIGRISPEQKNRIIKKYNAGEIYTDAELGLILQPVKPVQVGRKLEKPNAGNNYAVEYYVKTSSFPLIPQLTVGMQIDALRQFMEDNKIDRLVPKSAVKTGFYKSISITDKDGGLRVINGKLVPNGFDELSNELFASSIAESTHVLDRSFFRIQQDVPYNESKKKILEGSQMKKLKYSDLFSDWTFKLNGEEKSAAELKQLDDDIHTEIYARHYAKLMGELNAVIDPETGKGVLSDIGKLKEILIREAQERGFDFNDLMLLNTFNGTLGIDGTPLFMHPALPKIEALLNSLIKNKVLITKFPGKSYVQGSSFGFDCALSGTQNVISEVGKKVGVKLLSGFKGDLSYNFVKDDNGNEYIEAEVMMPWFFEEDMDAFIDKSTGQIDESKIDPKMLELIGYRIPTQDHGSMIKMKVVGFLPKSSGDLIIIPAEMSKIMGSDFDVDKLYAHRFNYIIDGGHISKIQPSSTDVSKLSDEELQNLSLDITHSILENPNITGRLMIQLDNDDVQDVLNKIKELQESTTKKEVGELEQTDPTQINMSKASQTSVLFDGLHSQFIDINAAGKTGIGIGSISSTSHVLAQYAGIYLTQYKFGKPKRLFNNSVKFSKLKGSDPIMESEVDQTSVAKGMEYDGNVTGGLFRLDRVFGITGKRISQVIKNIQTEAVDNAKNQRLFGMNLNKNTFDTALFLAKAGLDENYIGMFLNQPIIREYIGRLNNISDIGSTEFEVGAKEKLQEEIWNLHTNKDRKFPEDFHTRNISLEEMESAIAGKPSEQFQLDVLESFIAYSEMSGKLTNMFKAINVDTKYLGKSITNTTIKRDDFVTDFVDVKGIGNKQNLYNTLQLSAFEYGVNGSLELFGGLLPYEQDLFKNLREAIQENLSKDKLTEDQMDDLNAGIKNAIWTSSWNAYIEANTGSKVDIDQERTNMLYGKNSIAIQLNKLKAISPNTLIKLLNVSTSTKKGIPNVIEFPSAGSIEKDFSLKMQQSWLQLYKDPNTKEFARELVAYCILNGNQRNARDFSRFIPIDIMKDGGDKSILSSMNRTFNGFIADNENFDVVLKQFIQHNPNRALPGKPEDFNLRKLNGDIAKSISDADTIFFKKDESINQYTYFYDKDARQIVLFERVDPKSNQMVQIPTLGNKKSLLSEYNLDNPNKKSIFVENKQDLNPKEVVKVPPQFGKPSDKSVSVDEKYGYSDGVKVTYVLRKLITDGRNSGGIQNEGLIQLAEFLKDNYGELLNTVNLIHATDNSKFITQTTGVMYGEMQHSASGRNDNIVINFSNIRAMSKNDFTGFPESTADEMFALAFMHELLHKITKTKNVSKELGDLFEKFKATHKGQKFDKYKISVSEFISGIFTDKNLQGYLNEIQIEDKTLLDKIWDAIVKMISTEIKIKPGSLLDVSFKEAFKVISSGETKAIKNKYYEGNITPSENTIFVFGSNPEGRHGKGAALIAKNQFGAVYGIGEGLEGNSYALPTKDLRVYENNGFKSISTEKIIESIKKLYAVALQNPTKEFKIGYRNTAETSLNGYTGFEMIEMFNNAGTIPQNIIPSKEWYDTGIWSANKSKSSILDEIGNNFEIERELLEYIFSESDEKEAEKIDKFCNKKSKFGR